MPQLFRLMRFLSTSRLFTRAIKNFFQLAHLRKTFLFFLRTHLVAYVPPFRKGFESVSLRIVLLCADNNTIGDLNSEIKKSRNHRLQLKPKWWKPFLSLFSHVTDLQGMWYSWYAKSNNSIEERLILCVLSFLFTAARTHRVPRVRRKSKIKKNAF